MRKMIAEGSYVAAKAELAEWNEADTAAFLEKLPKEEMLKVFRLLPKDAAADVFAFLPIEKQQSMIESLTDQETTHIIENMYSDDAADLLDEMPSNVVKRILAAASEETRKDINHLLQYAEDSAGSLMTVEYVSLGEEWTVEQAMERIRQTGKQSETINVCYVLTSTRELVGTVSLRDLIFHEPDVPLKEFMEDRPIAVFTSDDQEDVAKIFQKYDFTVMPVVDSENRMLGIITVDDIVDIIEQEATEDMTKMAAILPTKKPYNKIGVFEEVRTRAPWLLLLMLSATFTGAIITSFEDKLASSIALAAYMPMLMDTGGNAGGQSSTMIIRALSLGEVKLNDFFRVLWKEIRVAACCGLILAVTNFFKMMLLDHASTLVAVVVCLTLVVTVICAKMVGSILPLAANRIGVDPAVMANPIITTIVDAISLMVYFRVAVWLMGI